MPEHLTNAAELGHRFGQAATLVVPTLIVAGLWMAWLLVGNLHGLLFTGYGQALLFKVFLVSLLLILAAANKLRFVPAMQSGDAMAAQRLARSIEVEAIVVLAVLATTATLTSVLTLPN
ncbi:CopD family protein [uncultured Ruegeria sp.]|uniref:CopD family protein n=1 Tax=uncultured Ruegeria sp. TaxID=259304 RepID=UPI0026198F14|nr:CopD family protein [uncultured Ruegeria sp.]